MYRLVVSGIKSSGHHFGQMGDKFLEEVSLLHVCVRTQKRKYLFTQHVVSLWNSLPQDVVNASGLDALKRRLDIFLEEKIYHRLQASIISRLKGKVPQNARCRGRGIRRLVSSCLVCSQRHLVGPL